MSLGGHNSVHDDPPFTVNKSEKSETQIRTTLYVAMAFSIFILRKGKYYDKKFISFEA